MFVYWVVFIQGLRTLGEDMTRIFTLLPVKVEATTHGRTSIHIHYIIGAFPGRGGREGVAPVVRRTCVIFQYSLRVSKTHISAGI